MFIFSYDVFLMVLALLAFPRFLYLLVVRKKYRRSFKDRLGMNFPQINKGDKRCIWIHACSVGETKAAEKLVKLIKRDEPNSLIVFSTVTETGHEEAKRSISIADYHVYLPFDISLLIRPIVKKAAPDLVVLVESEFWINFLKSAKDQGAKLVLINGKLSERSLRRLMWWRKIPEAMLHGLDLLCVQSQRYADRFSSLGIAKEKIVITGNMKLDNESIPLTKDEIAAWRQKLGLQPSDPVIVIGSTHDPEERLLLKAIKPLWESYPRLKVFIVPRHPERFTKVKELLLSEGFSYRTWSRMDAIQGDEQILLVDAMGVLKTCYQLADIALVAGSWTEKVGGHNILEPSSYGKPVLFGPYMHTQIDFLNLALEYQAGIQVNIENVYETLLDLLKNPEKGLKIGLNGKTMMQKTQGATDRTWNLIKEVVGN